MLLLVGVMLSSFAFLLENITILGNPMWPVWTAATLAVGAICCWIAELRRSASILLRVAHLPVVVVCLWILADAFRRLMWAYIW